MSSQLLVNNTLILRDKQEEVGIFGKDQRTEEEIRKKKQIEFQVLFEQLIILSLFF